MSSSVLRACSAQYYTACLPPGDALHRSGSANQLNGHAAQPQSPSSQQHLSTASHHHHPQATVAGVSGPARPHRTHSERSQRTSRMSLYRSNSSLDLDHNNGGGGAAGEPGALRGGPTRRDYGSASSLDLLAASAGDASFFAMLREYRAGKREDQRSPGPANIQEFLRGRLDPAPAVQNASNTLAHGALEEGSSPRLKTKFQRLLELRDRGKGWSRLPSGSTGGGSSSNASGTSGSSSNQESSLFRKWKPGGRSESADARSLEPALPDPAEERLRRRALAHYDCQSLGANLSRASGRLASILGRRRNTTTGASAASMLQRTGAAGGAGVGEDGAEGAPDAGDGRQSALLLSCPFFRNEVGGEPQRALGLTRATSRALRSGRGGSARNNGSSGPWHRPTCLSGLSILERPGLDDGACPYQRPATLLDGVDRGALYYRTHFHGKGHQNWFGVDDRLGPVAVSLRKDRLDVPNSARPSPGGAPQTLYRIIVRTSELAVLRCSLAEESLGGAVSNGRLGGGSSGSLPVRELLELAAPELQTSCLRLAVPGPATEQQLLKLDEQGIGASQALMLMLTSVMALKRITDCDRTTPNNWLPCMCRPGSVKKTFSHEYLFNYSTFPCLPAVQTSLKNKSSAFHLAALSVVSCSAVKRH
ncbi:hypothetical protein V5799_019717 [Amblyomma americanum]|uniref:Uncharacterized protein n=1 Tax=Amblyomma americanum TaxID=6943 RepID=A0AAQ4EWE5_AMBAM